MTRRLEAGFQRRFRDLLALVRPKRLEFGVELLLGRGRDRAARDGRPLAEALADLYLFTRQRVARRLAVTGGCTLAEAPWSKLAAATPCSSATRAWAAWPGGCGPRVTRRGVAPEPVLPGEPSRPSLATPGPDALLAEALADGLVVLTSVDDLLDRRRVREGRVLALWVPAGLELTTQLRLVLADLGLGLREPRCMACGGELQARAKEGCSSASRRARRAGRISTFPVQRLRPAVLAGHALGAHLAAARSAYHPAAMSARAESQATEAAAQHPAEPDGDGACCFWAGSKAPSRLLEFRLRPAPKIAPATCGIS